MLIQDDIRSKVNRDWKIWREFGVDTEFEHLRKGLTWEHSVVNRLVSESEVVDELEQQKTKGRPALSETEAKERIATCIKEYESLRGTKKQSKRNTLRGHCKRWPEWFREVAPNLFSELDSATKAKPN